jgi:hypothetical protein
MYPILFHSPISIPANPTLSLEGSINAYVVLFAVLLILFQNSSLMGASNRGIIAKDAKPNRNVDATATGMISSSCFTTEKLVPYKAADKTRSNRAFHTSLRTSEGRLFLIEAIEAVVV